jgi:hypothetical protein
MKSQQSLRPKRDDVLLWSLVAQECATRCCTHATRDIETVTTRVKHEGFSFLTITLANFGKDFERCLDQGYIAPDSFAGFQRRAGLPQFLGGFLELVFSRGSGLLLCVPSTDAIRSVRQLTLMYGKIQLPCTRAREKAAYQGYIECEKDVVVEDNRRTPIDLEEFRRVSATLYGKVFLSIDRKIELNYAVPKHGPGATADRRHGNAKYRQCTWPRRLEKWFPMELYLLPTPLYEEELAVVDILDPEAEIPVRVISVPKTLKTPRIIGVEPTAMQYAQQSLLPLFLEEIKRSHLDSFLGFDDQTPNQEMARDGSLNCDLATLDLSEASDRVSNRLVQEMMGMRGPLYQATQACRSRKADVPGYGVQRLAKYASMGSALTFPIEAMVFLTIVVIGIEKALNRQITKRDLRALRGKVRIYGDDIIVPVEYVHSVVDALHTFGMKVNVRKSFWNGKFRESCGKEYYDGEDVSIVRVRQVLPTRRRHVQEIIAMVAFRNQLYWAGYWATCQWLDEKIRKLIKRFPVVYSSSPGLGRESVLASQQTGERTHPELHRPEVQALVVRSRIPKDTLEGAGALLKCLLLKQGRDWDARFAHLDPIQINADHLTRDGRASSVTLQTGWVTPY